MSLAKKTKEVNLIRQKETPPRRIFELKTGLCEVWQRRATIGVRNRRQAEAIADLSLKAECLPKDELSALKAQCPLRIFRFLLFFFVKGEGLDEAAGEIHTCKLGEVAPSPLTIPHPDDAFKACSAQGLEPKLDSIAERACLSASTSESVRDSRLVCGVDSVLSLLRDFAKVKSWQSPLPPINQNHIPKCIAPKLLYCLDSEKR